VEARKQLTTKKDAFRYPTILFMFKVIFKERLS